MNYAEADLSLALWHANNNMLKAHNRVLRALNLDYLEYMVLRTIAIDFKQQVVPQAYIRQRLKLNKMTLSHVLERLERKRYASRLGARVDERTNAVMMLRNGRLIIRAAEDELLDVTCGLWAAVTKKPSPKTGLEMLHNIADAIL